MNLLEMKFKLKKNKFIFKKKKHLLLAEIDSISKSLIVYLLIFLIPMPR